ncbi:MAG: hypothetical protein WC763_03470 [Candidatus Paceibacterota bacterium]|jgi:hypothetical protein
MKHRNIIIALGFVTTILSFMGIPRSWKEIAFSLIGLAVVVVAYSMPKGPQTSV